jgi:hypothetical protein
VTALLQELAVISLALLVSAGAVALLRDRGVLVPPPEMVVEEFVREVSLKRWGPARGHLTESLSERLGPDSLRTWIDAVERRVGRIEAVRGVSFFAGDAAAEAVAEMRATDGSRATLRLPLSREHGLWKISRLER